MNRGNRRFDKGFTLTEALLASVILAMTIAAIAVPFTAGAQSDNVDTRRALAVSLAEEMLEEILSKPFDDPDGASSPGPEGNELNRAAFDNMDDYHGYAEAAGAIQDFLGQTVNDTDADGLSRRVTVGYVYVPGQDLGGEPMFVQVTVEVLHKGDPEVSLTRLVYNVEGT